MDSIVPDMTAFDEANPLALNAPAQVTARHSYVTSTADAAPKKLGSTASNYFQNNPEELAFGKSKKPEEVKVNNSVFANAVDDLPDDLDALDDD